MLGASNKRRSCLIRAISLAGGKRTEFAGQYLMSFDPDRNDGRGEIVWTPHIANAVVFFSPAHAIETWRSVSRVRPIRPDGYTNRPLTMFTVEIIPR